MNPKFECSSPNFTISSIPDGTKFKVDREILIQRSAVFCDMFSCCDSQDSDVLELTETSSTLNILFNFLHHPPPPFPTGSKPKGDFTRIKAVYPDSTIPFPLLPQLLRLADKYAFTEDMTKILYSHLTSYSAMYPLQVYGYAVELGLDDLASKTTYTSEEIKVIPTAEAYHKLVLLQQYRVKRLGEILKTETIFPHGYGLCSKHKSHTESLWEKRKEVLSTKIQPATDVAGEMGTISQELGNCETCLKACTAAVSMLAYKCAKVPRTIDKLPTES
ncbi:hypothetical protein C8Q75DRAFT_735152 [Abortiporus biennis]|nr:hypothetical protein C8Q75DRAFT_735152 [Abortiporus biennis]